MADFMWKFLDIRLRNQTIWYTIKQHFICGLGAKWDGVRGSRLRNYCRECAVVAQ